MRVFFDIGHPAHVHYFKHTIFYIIDNGGSVFVSARDRYPVFDLLEAYGIPYYNRGRGKDSLRGKFIYMLKADAILYMKARKFNPDFLIGFGSPYIAHISKVLGKPSLVVDDTDNAHLNHRLYRPFASYIMTTSMFRHDFGKKHIRFDGFMEMAYLHPKYFQPDESILSEFGLKKGDKFSILRFVGWNANHDVGHDGINDQQKIDAVNRFSKFGKVFITSEAGVPDEIKSYTISIAPYRLHNLMAYASLLFGESATMASECAMLGVPAIYIDNDGRSYTDELEHVYGIVKNFNESEDSIAKAIETGITLLEADNREAFQHVKQRLLSDKKCFTDVLIEFLATR
ncbi:DUF354 domain-containing protein [uncultured Roseivirga sp.]|uniref:DUF354 domain-containing protein n=1 Tax=uncultured Roseivirga sp. TaxID=543088 RepID=UPI0025902889|nr:DUF354 domain-containing protein [uncultured Roseivirga sp.]|tara:strand:- start:11147 stop:12175 length:1029 start_codon:yes stop_codon:yes gene_type:complete